MIDKNELYSWVDKLTTEEQATVFDFVQFLVERRDHHDVKKFYESVPETDEPLTEEERRQINDNIGWVDWEAFKN